MSSCKPVLSIVGVIAFGVLATSVCFGEDTTGKARTVALLQLASQNKWERLTIELQRLREIGAEVRQRVLLDMLSVSFGVHYDEMVVQAMLSEGDAIIPTVLVEKGVPRACDHSFKEHCRSEANRNSLFDRVLEDLRLGRVTMSYRNEERAKARVDVDLDHLSVFIADYQKNTGLLPKDLEQVRVFALTTYGYKLKVFDPAGERYQYVVDLDQGTYSLLDSYFSRGKSHLGETKVRIRKVVKDGGTYQLE